MLLLLLISLVQALYHVEVNYQHACGSGPIHGVQVKEGACSVVNMNGVCEQSSMKSTKVCCVERLEHLPFPFVLTQLYYSHDTLCNNTRKGLEIIPINVCYNRARITCTANDVELYTYDNAACTGVATKVTPIARDLCITDSVYPAKYDCY